jgi:hypothetical protein
MTTLTFVVFVLTTYTVKKMAPHGAETTKTTLAFVVFVFTAYTVVLKRCRLIELRQQ